ncbi:unknown [Prevotella sp. CAG:1185]|nr:unknown [Prevotella sp. CAG:1185]
MSGVQIYYFYFEMMNKNIIFKYLCGEIILKMNFYG